MRQLLVPAQMEMEGWRAKGPDTDPSRRGAAAELPGFVYSALTAAEAELVWVSTGSFSKKSYLSTPKH